MRNKGDAVRAARKPKIPSAPPVPTPKREPLTILEEWYVDCLRRLTAHLKRPPSLPELSIWMRRAVNPVYVALLRAERKGHVKRNRARKFVILPTTKAGS